MMTDTRFFAILAAMTAAAISVSAYDIDLEPDAAKRRTVTVFKSQGPQTASLYLKAPSPWVIAGSAITAQDDSLWSAVSTTPNTRTHVYQMVNAHSSQQHVSIFGFLTQPGPGPGRNPWFKATVPAVDIDWEAHSGAGHESDEDAWTGLCPVTTDQSRRSKIIVRPLKDDFGLVSGWMTLECWPTDGVRFLKEDGATALWHGASVSYSETPLTLYVDPVPEKAGPFTVTLKGDMDDAFNRPTDYLTGRAVLLDLDVDADNNGAINDADDLLEETPGGILATGTVKQVALKLAPAGLTGTLKLLAVSGGSHIRLWRDAGKTSSLALSDAEWDLSGGYTFPTALYVEGIDASAAVRDVHLRLRYTAAEDQNVDDNIRLTVINVETETYAAIPTNRSRRKIGVGERVKLTLNPYGLIPTWTHPASGTLSITTGNSATFTADDHASNPSITVTYGNCSCSTSFNVVEPESETCVRMLEETFPSGVQGAGMLLEPITVSPTDVSFARVEMMELPGPASNVTGYFTNFPSASLAHSPNPDWVQLDEVNQLTDHASFSGCPPPWSVGGFQWDIPVRWRVVGSPNVKTLPNRLQKFSINGTNGNSTVSKLGKSVTRAP
ncbi:MAG: hypothetical protein RBU24_15495 [Kiritimatiellia bacterium]|jgi:hypothetical protein|nr:hypothetical protein [Kiritimatiellia bacterium]